MTRVTKFHARKDIILMMIFLGCRVVEIIKIAPKRIPLQFAQLTCRNYATA